MKQGKAIAAQVGYYSSSVDFWLADYRDGRRFIAQNIAFEATDDGLLIEPSLRVPLDAAQEMFEQLWSQGFRSKHDRGGADRLDAARTEHIEDLRRAAKLKWGN
jgi:hypothetical protein